MSIIIYDFQQSMIDAMNTKAKTTFREADITALKDELEKAKVEFNWLFAQECIARENEATVIKQIINNLESFYRKKYEDVLFPFFHIWGKFTTFDDPKKETFVDFSSTVFVRRWNNYFGCFPIRKITPSTISVFAPEELEEHESNPIEYFNTPFLCMLNCYIKIAELIQTIYGVLNPVCEKRECEYNYGRKCIYEDVRYPDKNKRLCDNEKEVD